MTFILSLLLINSAFAAEWCHDLLTVNPESLAWDKMAGLHYFTPDEKEAARLRVFSGRLYNSAGESFGSSYVVSFVVDSAGEFYVFNPKTFGKLVRHPSPVGDEKIIFAGEATFFNGLFDILRNSSGHYKPDYETLRYFLIYLTQREFDLSQTRIHFSEGKENSVDLGMAREVMKNVEPNPAQNRITPITSPQIFMETRESTLDLFPISSPDFLKAMMETLERGKK